MTPVKEIVAKVPRVLYIKNRFLIHNLYILTKLKKEKKTELLNN